MGDGTDLTAHIGPQQVRQPSSSLADLSEPPGLAVNGPGHYRPRPVHGLLIIGAIAAAAFWSLQSGRLAVGDLRHLWNGATGLKAPMEWGDGTEGTYGIGRWASVIVEVVNRAWCSYQPWSIRYNILAMTY